jgi:hypothetical protein
VTTNVSASDAATAHDGAAQRKIANRLRRARASSMRSSPPLRRESPVATS